MKSKAHGKRCPEGTAPGPVQCELETDEGGEKLVFERSLFPCSPRLHLFNHKYTKTVILLQYKITVFVYVFKMYGNLYLLWQSCIFSSHVHV